MARSLTSANDIGAKLLQSTRRLIDRQVQSPDARARVAQHLKLRLEEFARGGITPAYQMFVDQKQTKDLSSVTFRKREGGAEGSLIEIQFQLLDGVARAILSYAKAISPIRSGAFAEAWFLLVDGVPYTDFSTPIPFNSTVILTNFAPYGRKLEERGRIGKSGRLGSYVRPENVVTERTRQWAKAKFPGAQIERLFVVIPGGGSARGWQVPYILKRPPHTGEEITYPALRITER